MADIKTAPPPRRSRNEEPPWAIVVDEEPAASSAKAAGGSRWMIPAYIPWFNWLTWLYLGAKTRHQLYYWFGALYLAPFVVLLAVVTPENSSKQDLPDWLTAIGVVSWCSGLVQLFAMKKEIHLRLQYATATGQADVNLWPPAWRVWSYIPGVHWATWIHASIRSRYVPYYFLAVVYAIPFALYIALSKQTPDGHTDGPAWALTLVMVSWVACIIHATLLTGDVNARIEHVPQGGQGDLDLEQRIRQEYEAKAPALPAPALPAPALPAPALPAPALPAPALPAPALPAPALPAPALPAPALPAPALPAATPAAPQAPGRFADPFAVSTFPSEDGAQPTSQSKSSSVLWTLVPTREKVVKALKAKLEQKAMDWIWEGAKWAGGFSLSMIMVWVKNKVG
jgi:hypothetical protein